MNPFNFCAFITKVNDTVSKETAKSIFGASIKACPACGFKYLGFYLHNFHEEFMRPGSPERHTRDTGISLYAIFCPSCKSIVAAKKRNRFENVDLEMYATDFELLKADIGRNGSV